MSPWLRSADVVGVRLEHRARYVNVSFGPVCDGLPIHVVRSERPSQAGRITIELSHRFDRLQIVGGPPVWTPGPARDDKRVHGPSSKRAVHRVSRISTQGRHDRGVMTRSDGDSGVAEPFGDDDERDAFGEHQRRGRVAKIVEPGSR